MSQAVPQIITNLVATDVTAQSVALSWDVDQFAPSYKIYRDGVSIGTSNIPSYIDLAVSPGVQHSYEVSGVNARGEGAKSTAISVTTLANQPPIWVLGSPQLLTAGISVAINLSAACSDPDGDSITYSLVSGAVSGMGLSGSVYSGTPVASASANLVFRANDGTVTADTTITFLVASPPDTAAPTVPTAVTASATSGIVTLSWSSSDDATGISHYRIFRDGVFVANKTDPPYTQPNVSAGIYIYAVAAVDSSPLANESSAASASPVTVSALASIGDDGYEFPPGTTSASNFPLSIVPTFENAGIYWGEAGSSTNVALVRFRQLGTTTWRQGHNLWYDSRTQNAGTQATNSTVPYGFLQHRGSLVKLAEDTTYQVQCLTATTRKLATGQFKTWSAIGGVDFPTGTTVTPAASSNSTLTISTGGSANGFRVYERSGGFVVDCASAAQHGIEINAPYVILRGATVSRVSRYGITLGPNAHHVVITSCDISRFGHKDPSTIWACNGAGGIATVNVTNSAITNIVIQNNHIHRPNFDSNYWTEGRLAGPPCGPGDNSGHPAGACAIEFNNTGGNHVVRYNLVDSSINAMFDDIITGQKNFSVQGDYRRDTDFYGNRFSYCWDDALQLEGAGMNCRIYENYIEQMLVAISNACCALGPLYVFRNVATKSQRDPNNTTTSEGWFWKGRNQSSNGTTSAITMGGGRIYLYHNTAYNESNVISINQAVNHNDTTLYNVVSRNNIWNTRNQISSQRTPMQTADFDYDLVSQGHSNWLEEEANGVAANPTYDPSHASGPYTLANTSRGRGTVDPGQVIPNFNDIYQGVTTSTPDRGAVQRGQTEVEYGVR